MKQLGIAVLGMEDVCLMRIVNYAKQSGNIIYADINLKKF